MMGTQCTLCLQDAVLIHPTKIQAARAANVTYCMLQYRRDLDREELNPVSDLESRNRCLLFFTQTTGI